MSQSLIRKKSAVVLLFIILFPLTDYAKSPSFNVLDYGAVNDGTFLNTTAIQAAIDACAESGGGTVVFPAGIYISGTLYLKSNVGLHLVSGAILEGSKDLKDYPVTIARVRSYTDNYTNKCLIYAEDLENISITGTGTIDGNGAHFKTERMVNDDNIRQADDWAHYKLRPFIIRMINCENILVRDVKIINSPMWVQHYLACKDVNINGITVISHVNYNNDGIDIDGCENVMITNCLISSGDDAIVLKSTLDRPCKDIVISNSVLSSTCNAFKLGTESNGGFENIVLNNCTIKDTQLAGIALEVVDGGILDGVNVSNVTMNKVGTAIFIRLGNRARPFMEGKMKIGMGQLSNVIISDIQAKKVDKTGCSITGLQGYPVKDITLENIRISYKGGGTSELIDREIDELPDVYPEYSMFGLLPAYGFFVRHAEKITFSSVELDFDQPEARPAMIFDDVKMLELSSIDALTNGRSPVLQFKGIKRSLINSCMHLKDTPFLQLTGPESEHVTIAGNDLSGTLDPVLNDNNSSVYLEHNLMATDIIHQDEQAIDCDPRYIDDRYIRIKKPDDVASLRLKIIKVIWGKGQIPMRNNVKITKGIISPLNPCSSLAAVDKIEIPMDSLVLPGNGPEYDLAYHFKPVNRNNRLVVFNPGHLCTMKTDPEAEIDYGTEATITGLLEKGFDVLAVYMPHVSENNCRQCLR